MQEHHNWAGPRRRPNVRAGSLALGDRRQRGSPGSARQNYEKYLARALEAHRAGDSVEMENCYQHAEHYFRVMRGVNGGA
jgi:hypothetical protein